MQDFNIGSDLRKARRAKGLKQTDVAQSTGINQSLLSAYENNNTMPSLPNFIRLCELYQVSADFILFNKDIHELTSYQKKLLEDALVYDDIIRDLHYLDESSIEKVRVFMRELLV